MHFYVNLKTDLTGPLFFFNTFCFSRRQLRMQSTTSAVYHTPLKTKFTVDGADAVTLSTVKNTCWKAGKYCVFMTIPRTSERGQNLTQKGRLILEECGL